MDEPFNKAERATGKRWRDILVGQCGHVLPRPGYGAGFSGGGMGTGDTMEDGWSLLGEAKLFEKMSERGRSRSWGGWVLL